jgi:hypothetical protein
MRTQVTTNHTKLWLSANDTYSWAHKPGASWPCSFLSGRRVVAEFDRHGDLVDLSIDGGRGDQDCPCDEFDALVEDMLGSAHPTL